MMKPKTTTAVQEEIDWAGLHQDLLHLISQKLPNISDFIRFRVVCKRWRRAAPKFELSPRFPWILQYRTWFDPDLHFCSISSGEIYTFDLGNQKTGSPIGMAYPAKNFLNLLHHTPNQEIISMNLPIAPLHPINWSQIIIPPPPRKWHRHAMMEPYFSKTGEYGIFLENILHETKSRRLDGSKDWIFKEEIYNGNGCAYFKGKYFSDCESEGTKIIDVTNGAVLFTIPPIESANSTRGFRCLIESSSGDLFKVFRPYDINLDFEKTYFEIYRLVMNNEQPFWVEIKNIKDEMFFLDYLPQGLALSAGDFAGLKGNCIYFLKGEMLENENEPSFIACKYDLNARKIEKLPCPLKKWNTWVIPFVQ